MKARKANQENHKENNNNMKRKKKGQMQLVPFCLDAIYGRRRQLTQSGINHFEMILSRFLPGILGKMLLDVERFFRVGIRGNWPRIAGNGREMALVSPND